MSRNSPRFAPASKLPVGIFLFLLTVFGACSDSRDERATLYLALKASPNQLDPALVVDAAEGEICSQLFQGLVRFSPEGDIVPSLARSWRTSPDGKSYRFLLDRGMKFHGGRRVTVEDVVFSFERVLSPASRSPRKWVLERLAGAGEFSAGAAGSISGVSAPDDSTLVLELNAPFQPFLSMLALPAAMVVPREALAGEGFGEFEGLPSGSGPWMLRAWERGDYLELAPNPHFPSSNRGISSIVYRVIPEAFTRIAELESGTLDVLEIPQAELGRFLEDRRYSGLIQSRAELRVFYVGLNNTKKPFDDVRVRRALNMAVDVDQLIETLANGQGVAASGAIPPALKGYVRRERYPYDVDAARRLLSEAGYPEGFSMEIWQRESPEGTRMLEAIQGYLKRAGIDVRLVRREWSAFKEAVSAGRVDAFFLDWFADYPDAENFISPLFHSDNAGGGGNRSFFKNADVDRLIDAAGRLVDEDEASRVYARIDSLVYDQAPWIYLYFPKTFYAVSAGLSGYKLPSLYLGNDFTAVSKKRN